MELSIYNVEGKDTGRKINLDDSIFGIEPNDHAIYLDVKQYMANKRQGTHKSKERGEVAGSRRKLGRQKGGGGARPGDIKSPIRVGGGRIFGPRPRNYNFKLNKKVKQLARKSAFSYKIQENAIRIIEDFTYEAPKTKDFVALMNSFDSQGKKSLLVMAEVNENVFMSARNLQKSDVTIYSEINTYKILDAKCLILTEKAVASLTDVFNA